MGFQVSNLFDNDNVVSPKGLKKQNLPYIFIWIIYYAWVIAFATWWTASPLTENAFGSQIRSLLHAVNLLSSAVFMIMMKKEWFVKMARIGAVLILTGMTIFLAVPSAPVQVAAAIIIGISLGCVNISILMPFVFTLNNTEKLYAVVGTNLLICLISLFQNANDGNHLHNRQDLILSFVVLIIALSAVVFFKKNSVTINFNEDKTTTPQIPRRIYLTLVFNCAFAVLGKGIGTGILNITAENVGNSVVVWYYIGGILGCLIYFVLYAFTSKPFILIGNITFAFIAMGLLCNAFIAQAPSMAILFALLLGAGNTTGMINMYYIIGVVGKKYSSIRYLKWSIVLIGVCGGVSGIAVGNIIQNAHAASVVLIASIITAFAMMIFMILSPILTQEQYYSDWAKDSEMPEIDNDQLYLFRKYQLSKREIEVCKLLLQGYTLRQIAAMLSLSYSTVNTYCTGSYRKLNINSRTELMVLFKDFIAK
ncbi:MAG: helix-turn-helix transcriptional regulator [Oscillospiraceae bacterium]|nr:helix-turn-helix transcriptional regulator [Oscillospiraceae bacterium]